MFFIKCGQYSEPMVDAFQIEDFANYMRGPLEHVPGIGFSTKLYPQNGAPLDVLIPPHLQYVALEGLKEYVKPPVVPAQSEETKNEERRDN